MCMRACVRVCVFTLFKWKFPFEFLHLVFYCNISFSAKCFLSGWRGLSRQRTWSVYQGPVLPAFISEGRGPPNILLRECTDVSGAAPLTGRASNILWLDRQRVHVPPPTLRPVSGKDCPLQTCLFPQESRAGSGHSECPLLTTRCYFPHTCVAPIQVYFPRPLQMLIL